MFAARYFGGRHFGARYFGKNGDTSPGFYWGKRYVGQRYFGRRYFGSTADSAPFVASSTAALSLSGTLTYGSVTTQSLTSWVATVTRGVELAGTLSINAAPLAVDGTAFVAGAPLELGLSGTIGFSGVTVELLYSSADGKYFGGTYFGRKHFGNRYWGTGGELFVASATTALALSGEVTYSATPVQALGVNMGTLALSGTMGFSAEVDQQKSKGGIRRSVSKLRAYSVKIDEEEFIVHSLAEAEQLLETAVEAAKEKADAAVKRIEPLKGKAKRKAVKSVAKQLDPPTITADDDLAAAALQAQSRIAQEYEAAVALAQALIQRDQDEEDILLLL